MSVCGETTTYSTAMCDMSLERGVSEPNDTDRGSFLTECNIYAPKIFAKNVKFDHFLAAILDSFVNIKLQYL